jgi:hypothetical protein
MKAQSIKEELYQILLSRSGQTGRTQALRFMLNCSNDNDRPTAVSPRDVLRAMRLLEAEGRVALHPRYSFRCDLCWMIVPNYIDKHLPNEG